MNDETFWMPAEWEPHAAMWLAWPDNADTWSQNLPLAQAEFREFVEAVAKFERVNLIGSGQKFEQLKFQSANVRLVSIPTNDAWARDYAPTFVTNKSGQLRSIDWHYNAWGGKYPPFDEDQKVASRIAKHLDIENQQVDLVLEGGAIEVDGKGTLITTRSCVLAKNRNPDATVEKVEQCFANHLGVKDIIWLPGDAIEGDDTDGHIDQLARFTDQRTIVHAWTAEEDDPRLPPIQKNIESLKTAMANLGREYRYLPLPIPDPIKIYDLILPASYCNFLIVNGGVIVPQFGQSKTDAKALVTLSQCFPDRTIVPLASKNLTVGLGSFHCLSQQQPR